MNNITESAGTLKEVYDLEFEGAFKKWKESLFIEQKFWDEWVLNRCYNREIWDDLNNPNRELLKEVKLHIYSQPGDSVRILDVGSGPLTALGFKWRGRNVTTIAIDPLADAYNENFRKLDIQPPIPPINCEAEKLSAKFSENEFDFVWATDSLDRSYNPLLSLKEMLYVLKPGSMAQTRNKKNSYSSEDGNGIYNWNFDCQNGEFVIWRGNLKIYVQDAMHRLCHIKCEEIVHDDGKHYIYAYFKKLNDGENHITCVHQHQFALISRVVDVADKKCSGESSITYLANKFGSDKGTEQIVKHAYSYIYDLMFWPYKEKEINLLEMGLAVGGPELGKSPNRQVNSPSIAIWLEYFSRAIIFGFDISDFSHMNSERFTFIQGDSGVVGDVQKIKDACNSFDIIIDDASHASVHQQIALRELYQCLRPGGLYIIEDLHWQSPFYESDSLSIPKTAHFLSELFENGLYLENEIISYENASYLKYNTLSYSSFPGFKDGIQSIKMIVMRKK